MREVNERKVMCECDIVALNNTPPLHTAEKGQRAFVGKVCMDQLAPDYYIETTDQSLKETER